MTHPNHFAPHDSPLDNLLAEQAAKKVARDRRVRVTLPQSDVERALNLAHKRNRKEHKYGAMTYGMRLTGIEAHAIGMIAEQAVAHYYGVEIDERIFDDRGDDGVDIVLSGVGLVGVKCTTYAEDPYLRVEGEHCCESVAAYILTYVNVEQLSDVWLIGWATREEVLAARTVSFVPGGPVNYVLEEHQLRGINSRNIT